MDVPAGATNLVFNLSGGTGDADLYVKFGSAPTDSVYDCRPFVSGNTESCSFAAPQAGTYHVRVKAFSTRSEEHTSELQSLMRMSYAVFCLKKTITAAHVD